MSKYNGTYIADRDFNLTYVRLDDYHIKKGTIFKLTYGKGIWEKSVWKIETVEGKIIALHHRYQLGLLKENCSPYHCPELYL